jgi:hypothetical protein
MITGGAQFPEALCERTKIVFTPISLPNKDSCLMFRHFAMLSEPTGNQTHQNSIYKAPK